jgi:hypothetical protein
MRFVGIVSDVLASVAILDARNITTEQTGSFFDIALR